MDHLDPFGDRHNGIGDTHAEVLMEMRFEAYIDTLFHFTNKPLHGMGRGHTKGIDQGERVHVTFIGDFANEVHHPAHLGAGKIDREEHDFEALLMGKLRCFDGCLDRLFKRPFISIFDDVRA